VVDPVASFMEHSEITEGKKGEEKKKGNRKGFSEKRDMGNGSFGGEKWGRGVGGGD